MRNGDNAIRADLFTITVCRRAYANYGGTIYYAFWVAFPDATHTWAHSTAQVRRAVRDYAVATGRRVAIHWLDGSGE